MKNKYMVNIILLITIFTFTSSTVYAEFSNENNTAESLADKIYITFIEYKEIELNDQKAKLDDYTVKKYLDDAERQIEANNKNIEQAETKLNLYDISREEKNQFRYQIEYLKLNSFELQRSKHYYEMQNKLSELYEKYSKKIVQNQNNELKCEAYKKLCEIKVYEFQMSYLKILAEHKKKSLDVTNKSFKIGYATENSVLVARAEYAAAKSELEACKNNYDDLIIDIEKKTGYKLDKYTLNFPSHKNYEIEKYLNQFQKQNINSEYYLKQSEIYNEYFKSLDKLATQMDNEYNNMQYKFLFSNNEEFFERTYKYISNEKKYYENETDIYKLNSEKYLSESELYIVKACSNLNTLLSHRSAKLLELKAAESSYEIAQKLLNEGRINELNLIEAKCDLKRIEYDIMKLETDILVIKYELENMITA